MKSFTKGLIIFAFIAFGINAKAQIGINNSDPHESSILDIKHDTKGVLFPRIPNSAPLDDVQGMFFYATEDNKFYYYDSTSWQCINPLNSTSPTNARLNGSLEIQGNLDVEAESTISGFGTIPMGGIIMWSGEHDELPDGWALCNGEIVNTIQTPDLRGRFVVGHSIGTNATNDPRYNGVGNKNVAVSNEYNYVGDVGGDTVVSLEDGNIPQHEHEMNHNHTITDPEHSHKILTGRNGGNGEITKQDEDNSAMKTTESSPTGITINTYTGSTEVWGGAFQEEIAEYDYTGSSCQYLISEPNCTDIRPYSNFIMKSDICGNFIPIVISKATKAVPIGDPIPIPNPEFFGSKPECENPDYNPNYGTKTVITAAHFGVDPVSTRPPYYVIAFIIRVK